MKFTTTLLAAALCAFGSCAKTSSVRGVRGRKLRQSLAHQSGFGGSASQVSKGSSFVKLDPLPIPPADLPSPVSDHSSSFNGSILYVAGGCESPITLVDSSGNLIPPSCAKVSRSLFIFNPNAYPDQYQQLPNMPTPRYKHCSALANGRLWLVGGLDESNTPLLSVDVFELASNEWTSYDLPAEYGIFDHACLVVSGALYVLGGYKRSASDGPMVAQNAVYSIDAQQSIAQDTLKVADEVPMLEARAQFAAITKASNFMVFGGYSNVDCPLVSVEQYDFSTQTWTMQPSMTQPRAGASAVTQDATIFILGGEASSTTTCGAETTESNSVASVEAFLDGRWVNVRDKTFPPTISSGGTAFFFDLTESIYVVGGNSEFDPSCDCLVPSDQIRVSTTLLDSAKSALYAPTNDACGEAISLTPSFTSSTVSPAFSSGDPISIVFGTTLFSTRDDHAPICNAQSSRISQQQAEGDSVGASSTVLLGQGVWFVVWGTGERYHVSTRHWFTNFDHELFVYTSNITNSCTDYLACADVVDATSYVNDANGENSDAGTDEFGYSVTWDTDAGITYYILLHGYDDTFSVTDQAIPDALSTTGEYAIWIETLPMSG